MIFTLQSHEIAEHWNEIEPLLFEHYDSTPVQIRTELDSARAQLWALKEEERIRGIVITKLMDRIGILWIASGKGLDSEAMCMLGVIESWMKEKGCKAVKIEGRRGWGRVLDGYEETATIFVKRLQ